MIKNFLASLISLTLFCFTIHYFSKSALSIEIDTGNILSNSTFGTGTTYSNDNWTITNEDYHNYTSLGGGNDPGGAVAADNATNIEQTIKLSEKTNMTEKEIQNGFSSTLSADIWYWNQYDNTTTLKQTITGSDGSTTIQQRIIEDDGCSYINCGSYTNYTDTHIQGSNTQTDFDIKVNVSNSNNRGSSHYGPDIDDIQLKVVYTYINPLDEDTQDVIDEIDETIDDAVDNIDLEEENFSWDTSWENEYYLEEDFTWEDDYYWEDEFALEEEFYFEEEFNIGNFEEFEFTEFEEVSFFSEFEEITMEETFFEEEFGEPEFFEEIFEEEFEEVFTDFIEEAGMSDEFEQFLEDEGITQEEFFEEITEEEFNDEFTEESFEEFEEVAQEESITEESTSEISANEEATMEEATDTNTGEQIEEEQEVATNDTQEETTEQEEPSSESTEDTEVQTEDSEEQDVVQSKGRDELDTKDRITKDVRKVESKLKKDLKKVAKQLAQIAKQNTQNLSKEDIFFRSNNKLNAYLKTNFYKSKEIYKDTNLELYNQVDLGVYNTDIYTGVTLASYSQNDPIETHNKKLQDITIQKRKLMIELEALKNGKPSN